MPHSEQQPEDVEAIRARLREEFPEWSIVVSSKSRWWASHTIVSETLGTDAIDADGPDELRELLLRKTSHGRAR
jgi:hypothetical protein